MTVGNLIRRIQSSSLNTLITSASYYCEDLENGLCFFHAGLNYSL